MLISRGIQAGKAAKSTGSAFEDALYGSGSEEESDDENPPRAVAKKGILKPAKPARAGAFIQEDEDAPMDLLDRSIAGRVTGQFFPQSTLSRTNFVLISSTQSRKLKAEETRSGSRGLQDGQGERAYGH